MSKLFFALLLMLVVGDEAIGDDQAPAPPAQSQPGSELSPLMFVCTGELTVSVPKTEVKTRPDGRRFLQNTTESRKSDVSDVTVILYSNNPNVFTSLFDMALPVTSFYGDYVEFDKSWENQGTKHRITGSVSPNGGVGLSEYLWKDEEGFYKISSWDLHCKKARHALAPPLTRAPGCWTDMECSINHYPRVQQPVMRSCHFWQAPCPIIHITRRPRLPLAL